MTLTQKSKPLPIDANQTPMSDVTPGPSPALLLRNLFGFPKLPLRPNEFTQSITQQPMNTPTLNPPTMSQRVYENPVFGDKATFLKTSAETNGAYTLLDIEVAPKGSNSLHAHQDFTETFRPVEGPLTVQIGRERKILQPGEVYTVPLNTPHYFINPTDQPVKFQVELRPGHSGFENAIKIAYGLATDGLTDKKGVPTNFKHLALLATMSGTAPSGIFSLLTPLLRWKARQARKEGIEKQLMDRYCK